jgi:MinD-like ATPase involved in chromosome partitioning or flagellar assembly
VRPAPQPATTSFEPGTKVANFHWPGVCRTLLREHGTHYDQLADLLLAESAKRSVIGMLGLFPGGGCTTTLLCLAARLAGRGRRVIIVDGNFLAPQLAQWLDVETTATWQDVLADGAPVADAIVRAPSDNLDLLPFKSQTRDGFKLASGAQVSRTADTLRSVYDLTLVDLGAFFDAQSQPMLLSLVHNLRVDAALAVAGPQAADPRDVATLAEYLREQQCELLGTIENRATK